MRCPGAFGLIVMLAAAVPAATQTWTGAAFCICPSGKRGNVQLPQTCESFCGTSSRSHTPAPSVDYGAIQRAQEAERLAREQRAREAAAEAARRARKAMEQRQFEANKADALRSLKGVSTGDSQLKGIGGAGPNGLKGIDSGEIKLKGLDSPREERVPEEPEDKPKSCHIVDKCSDALEGQEKALDAARRDQADIYMAMGTADLKHGINNAKGLLEKLPDDAPTMYVWKGKDKAGLPTYLRDYKTNVDGISDLIGSQRAAALSGKYDVKKTGLFRSSAFGSMSLEDFQEKMGDLREEAATLSDFAKYMREMVACSKGADAQFDDCAKKAFEMHEKLLSVLPVAEATKARIQAAGDVFQRYSTRALDRAKSAATAAAGCFKGCR